MSELDDIRNMIDNLGKPTKWDQTKKKWWDRIGSWIRSVKIPLLQWGINGPRRKPPPQAKKSWRNRYRNWSRVKKIRILLWRYSLTTRWQYFTKRLLPRWQKVVRVRTRLVLRRIRRSTTVAWIRTSWKRIKKSLRVRARLFRRRVRQNGYATATGLVGLTAFIALSVWLNQVTVSRLLEMGSIPWEVVGIVGLIIVVVVFLVWSLWNPARRNLALGILWGGRLWKTVATVAILAGIGWLVLIGTRYLNRPSATTSVTVATTVTETVFQVIAKKDEWSQEYHFPPGDRRRVSIRATSPSGRFSIMTQDGSVYSFTPEKSDVVPGVIDSARVMAIGDKDEEIRIRVYRLGA